MDFKKPDGKGIETRPVVDGLDLRVFRLTDPFLSLVYGRKKVLLHDVALVDSVFHTENDPIAPFYLSLDRVVDGLQLGVANAPPLVGSLNSIEGVFKRFADQFWEYTNNPAGLPEELIFDFFQGLAKTYSGFAFEGQAETLELAAKAAEKQLNFVNRLEHLSRKKDIKRIRDDYAALYSALHTASESANKASQSYDAFVEKYPLPLRLGLFPKFGDAPRTREPDAYENFDVHIELATRPRFRYTAHKMAKDSLNELHAALTAVQVRVGQAGIYSTAPELR